jgi:hypothetical protein
VKLENMLRRIHSDSDNLFHGRSPLSEISNNDPILTHSVPPGAVHTNNSDTGGEFEVRSMFPRDPSGSWLDRGFRGRIAFFASRGRRSGEFATSVNFGFMPNEHPTGADHEG